MGEILIIVIDNSYSSQNEDYVPNRFIVQVDTAKSLVNKKLRESPLNEIGVCPLEVKNFNVLTPSNKSKEINHYISKINLYKSNREFCIVKFALNCTSYKQQDTKTLLIFVGSKLDNPLKMAEAINEAMMTGLCVKVCFFGDGIQHSEIFENTIESDNYVYCIVGTDEDVYASVMNLFGENSDNMEDDPELAMALRLSLKDQ